MIDVRIASPAPVTGSGRQGRRNDGLDCEICGARMYERSCKIICRNCGFTRDCSDP